MKKTLRLIIPTTLALLPSVSFAQLCYSGGGTPRSFSDIVCIFVDLISTAIPVVAGLALLVFFWGLAKFILKAGDESAREEGKHIMFWGIIALFVLVSIWGIISFLYSDFFGMSFGGLPQLPM